MMEALMYGPIPIAKMVNRRRALPEKVSSRFSMPWLLIRASSAVRFTPGTGTWSPTTKSMIMPSTNISRARTSGMLHAATRFLSINQ